MTSPPNPTPDPLTPPLEALYWTQYGTWYPIFRRHAPKSTVIDIDDVQPQLLDWLDADTFVLPDGSGPSTLPTPHQHESSRSSSSTASEDGDEDEEEDEGEEAVKLPALDSAIRAVIRKYDSPVFPKLNWSAPLDAGFMLPGNSLQCLHPEDVYLLLKSSEFVARDLEQISHLLPSPSLRIRPQLVLKKWFALSKSYEFRVFVRAAHLLAITQRDVTFYEHLQTRALQSRIKRAIFDFWTHVVAPEQKWGLTDYVMDVYLTKDLARCWLVDVNAWLPRTDTLLFAFDELDALHLREKALRRTDSREDEVDEVQEGVVRLHMSGGENTGLEEEAWGESDVELRVLSDRRMQSAGGTGATYSSNMVPQDLVEFAQSPSNVTQNMSVDQIVRRWNDHVDSETP
ncbi:related to CDC123-protein controls the cell cycle by controlling eIF2gamma abundance [Sporisorium reilianum SRZ2]|uniref:Related to CDC123-protein controls the cell cycle by controlling eIF2gamma abundance n=1 Tax=Sporisorium reilianum (strain SRZ2) TaxID=999809 RepID=E6ZRG5_SPORE|nr:related to CDC123-protein controls the cell cycle by controlling eIF2gamma abundance [Sporisorium reilianum SRZ2]